MSTVVPPELLFGYGQHSERSFGGFAVLRDQTGPGRHRREALMPAGTLRYHDGHWHRGAGECR